MEHVCDFNCTCLQELAKVKACWNLVTQFGDLELVLCIQPIFRVHNLTFGETFPSGLCCESNQVSLFVGLLFGYS